MQNKVFRFNLDIKEKEFKTDFNLVQLDNTSILVIKLFDEGNKLETTKEDRAEIAIDKNDNTFCVLPCNLYDNEVNCTLDSNALASPGWTNCEVRILNEGKVLTSARFKIYIRESIVNNEKIKSTSEYKALEGLINEAKIMQESLKKGESVIEDVNKIKENLTEIKKSILNKSKEIDGNLAVADEKINLIKIYISKSETAIENLTKNQDKVDNLSNLLVELEKIKLTLDNLNTSVDKANTKKSELDTSIENASREKTELNSSVEKAKTQNTNLKNAITEAETVESSLEASSQKASSQQTNLEKTIADSITKNKTLSDTNKKSETLNTDLNALSQDLSSKITDGSTLKSNLGKSISEANSAKNNLDSSVATANSIDTTLKATDEEAKKTEALIRDLMDKLNLAKDEVQKIIASGNLEKYITDPKLQDILKSYAKKRDIRDFINKYVKEESIIIKTMTAVIDQTNSNPLTCVTYEDDAKKIEKGSSEWDDFFGVKLVLFKNGNVVRDLEDSELNNLKPEDGDVMVKFRRMGLNIKTVDNKIYVSMTDATNDEKFQYYAHTRGEERRDAFYLGAYLGYEENGKLRSIKGYVPTGNKTIGTFRTLAQANGEGYEQLSYYQWTFIQSMLILKYGSLDGQTAIGRGVTRNNSFVNTGGTNSKGIDFGTTTDRDQMRFQYLEDVWGNKSQYCDGIGTADGLLWIGTDKFNDKRDGYRNYETGTSQRGFIKKAKGDNERGFLPQECGASETTHYCDFSYLSPNKTLFAIVGGSRTIDKLGGPFYIYFGFSNSDTDLGVGARLMFL